METTRRSTSPAAVSGPAGEVQTGVEGITKQLAFDSPEAAAAIRRATRRFSANCLTLDEIDTVDALPEARLRHVRDCEFCAPLMKALKTAPPKEAFDFVSMAAPRAGRCPDCGAGIGETAVGEILGRLGVSEEMITSLKESVANVDVEEHLSIARDYLRHSSSNALTYAKENPGKVAAGVAVMAIGAGLLISALRDQE